MKIYDTISHRSYEVNPNDININRTRLNEKKDTDKGYRPVFLHEGTNHTYHRQNFLVSDKTLSKIVNTPRKKW